MSCGDGENGFGKFYMRILYFTTVTYGKTDKLSWAKLGHTGCTVGFIVLKARREHNLAKAATTQQQHSNDRQQKTQRRKKKKRRTSKISRPTPDMGQYI